MNDRLDKIEAVQHFMLAWMAAIASTHPDQKAMGEALRINLERHMAMLLAESHSEVKIQALQELSDQVLGRSD